MFYRNLFSVPTWGFNRPFREFDRLRRQMDELYGALSGGTFPMPSTGVFPLTNVTEDNENYYVRSELPGIKSDDLDIQVTEEGISISGERKIYEFPHVKNNPSCLSISSFSVVCWLRFLDQRGL